MRRRWWWLGLLVAGGLLVLPTRARACSCADEFITYPEPGTLGLPTNVRFWTTYARYEIEMDVVAPLVLYDVGTDEIIETSLQVLATPYDFFLGSHAPAQPLTPGSLYDVRHYQVPGDYGSDYSTLTTFSVADGPDEDPPAVPAVLEQHVWSYHDEESSCGPEGDRFGIAFDVELGAIIVLDRDGESTITDAPNGRVSAMTVEGGRLGVHNGSCTHNWPQAEVGARASLRLAAFDFSGNFSGWSDPIVVEIPELEVDEGEMTAAREGCGCGVGSPRDRGPGALAWLGPLGLAAWSRRRPRSRRR